ncbi:MAG: glutaredoxin 3 [Pseudomonadota bacterium]
MAKPVEIYTTPICPFCMMAKRLLTEKNIAFTEINVMGDSAAKAEMMQRANGRHTVPQIFVGDTHVGGCDDLYELDGRGKLDPLVADAA